MSCSFSHKTFFLGLAIAVFGLLAFVQTARATHEPDALGFAWSETAGWISFNSENDFGIPIGQSSDDAYHAPAFGWPDFSSGEGAVYAGKPQEQAVYGGWRWTEVNIPAEATITEAYVRLRNYTWGHAADTNLAFEKTTIPSTFSSANTPYDRWNSGNITVPLAWEWTQYKEDGSVAGSPCENCWVTTPSLAVLLGEVVGWLTSEEVLKDIVLLEDGSPAIVLPNPPNPTPQHPWAAFDLITGPNDVARLYVSWTHPTLGNFSNIPLAATAYKVSANFTTGILSGYAWSPYLGWISFDRAVTGPPPADDVCSGGECISRVDMTTGGVECGGNQYDICGWARVISACQDDLWNGSNCTGSGAGNLAGGWDGWIKLRGVWDDGAGNSGNYGLVWSENFQEFTGWAWGGEGAGWISFSSRTDGATPQYGVEIDLNAHPRAENLRIDDPFGDTAYCGANTARVELQWDFFDPNPFDVPDAFQILVRENSSCLADDCGAEINSCGNDGDGPGGSISSVENPIGGTCDPGNTAESHIPTTGNVLNASHPLFNHTTAMPSFYYWAVRVKDNRGVWSKWSEWAPVDPPTGAGVASFNTIRHRAPAPSFEILPQNPVIGEVVEFRDTSQCWCSDPINITETNIGVTGVAATPLNPTGYLCSTLTPPAGCDTGTYTPRYVWQLGDGSVWSCDSNSDPSCRGDQERVFDDLIAGQTMALTVTDDLDNFCSYQGSFSVHIPFPDWKEVSPF